MTLEWTDVDFLLALQGNHLFANSSDMQIFEMLSWKTVKNKEMNPNNISSSLIFNSASNRAFCFFFFNIWKITNTKIKSHKGTNNLIWYINLHYHCLVLYSIALPRWWRRRSTVKDMITNTLQTVATSHVGVYSNVAPSPAIVVLVLLLFSLWDLISISSSYAKLLFN